MPALIAPGALIHSPEYLRMLGVFHSNWSSIDLHTDFAIYQFLRVTPEQAHLITSGMVFGRKARLLADLIGHSSDPRKAKLMTAFNRIRAAKRDIVAHGYVASEIEKITFLERNTSGTFKAKEHVFTFAEFTDHAKEIHNAGVAFSEALDVKQEDLNNFVNAAFNLSRKECTPPERLDESR